MGRSIRLNEFRGENLKNIRLLKGYSQNQLALEINLSERDIWNFENGYRQPEFNELNRLKSHFNVQSMYFYQDDLLQGKANVAEEQYMSIRRNRNE